MLKNEKTNSIWIHDTHLYLVFNIARSLAPACSLFMLDNVIFLAKLCSSAFVFDWLFQKKYFGDLQSRL